MRLMDADEYCDFLNKYPLEKAQSNFMTFYRDALQHTLECEVKAIPIEWIECFMSQFELYGATTEEYHLLHYMLTLWEKENEKR